MLTVTEVVAARSILALALCTLVACAKDISDNSEFASGAGSANPTGASAGASGSPEGSTGPSGPTSGTGAASAGETGDGPDETSAGGGDEDTGATSSDTAAVSETQDGGSSAGSDGDDTGGEGETGAEATSSDSAGETAGTALDPELDVPTRGQSCTTPGSLGECPGSQVCRFYTAEEGRCETCDNCGNLNAPCSVGTDCDILFACYAGRCTNICPLGTFSCGPVENCLDVGHPSHGVCDPFA